MSHECPECSDECRCGGDIDDCMFNFPEDQVKCTHWRICENDEDGDEDDFEAEADPE